MGNIYLADALPVGAAETGNEEGGQRTTEAFGGGTMQVVITFGGDEPSIEVEAAPSLAAAVGNRGPIYILRHAQAGAPGMLTGESAGAATVANASDTGAGRHVDPERRTAPALSLENMIEGVVLAHFHLAMTHLHQEIADVQAQLAAMELALL